MLSDIELDRLRHMFFDAGYRIAIEMREEDANLMWADVLLDPTPDNLRALLVELQGTLWHRYLVNAIVEIGYASAADVLVNVPLPLDDVPIRRWQLRRHLARAVERMSDDQLQSLVWRAQGIAHG
jgi:hypothetical protein